MYRRTRPTESATKRVYSMIYMNAHVQRHPWYWFWNAFLPMAFLTAITFTSILVPATELADRLSINLVVLLTQVGGRARHSTLYRIDH